MSSSDPIVLAYSGQSGGASLPYFVGRQYGTGWLRSLARFAFPILKRVLGMAGKAAMNTAEDVITKEKPFKDSMKSNAINAAASLLTSRPTKRSSPAINKRKTKRNRTIFD